MTSLSNQPILSRGPQMDDFANLAAVIDGLGLVVKVDASGAVLA